MRFFKRTGALTLALLLLVSTLSACGKGGDSSTTPAAPAERPGVSTDESGAISVDLNAVTDVFLSTAGLSGDTVVAKAGDTDITAAALMYWVAYSADSMLSYYSMYGMNELPWDTEAEGQTLAQSMLLNSLDTAALYALLPQIAQQEGVTLSQDFQDSFQAQLDSMTEALGGEEYMNLYLWQYPLTKDLYAQLCESEDLNSQIQEKYFGEGGSMLPSDADILSFLVDEQQCYFFKHILLTIEETAADGSAAGASSSAAATDNSAEQMALAEELLAQLNASDDPAALFDQLMNEYSQDGGLAQYPNGYLGTASETGVVGAKMVPVVEEAALALKDGEISGILENDGSYHGYHIVMRLPVEGNVDPAEYESDYLSDRMGKMQQSWLEANPVVTNENFDKLDAADFYNTVTALREAVTAKLEADADAAGSGSAAGSGAGSSSAAGSASSPNSSTQN